MSTKKDAQKDPIEDRINSLEEVIFKFMQIPVEEELPKIDMTKVKFKPAGSKFIEPGPNLG